MHSSSVCAKHGWIQYKILHRTHWTKVKLSQIYSDVDPFCDLCRQAPATLAHMFWFCPTLYGYWSEIEVDRLIDRLMNRLMCGIFLIHWHRLIVLQIMPINIQTRLQATHDTASCCKQIAIPLAQRITL